jgi:flagellar basal body-associated protein FliL
LLCCVLCCVVVVVTLAIAFAVYWFVIKPKNEKKEVTVVSSSEPTK